jgi:4-amino-4-deoxy-L-arabinose transferase-like glycosyltransferase
VDRRVGLIAAAAAAVLVAFASRYGYHRDELYFLAAGEHLALSYADQGPLTPLIARLMSEIDSDSLTVLRIPSALAAWAIVVVTGRIACELGGGEVLAAACAAVASIVLVTGHLLSTSTFDLLAWTVVSWLVVRAVVRDDDRQWLFAGAVLGVGLLNKPLPAFLIAGLAAGVVIAGPRRLLRSSRVWAGGLIALALWSPWLIWQADHGWPQLDVSRSIASGGSTSSQPWWAIVPFQALLVSPVLVPVWVAGLVRLFRDARLAFVAWTWVVLAVLFMATGGKPYYLAGLLPVLLAAGALPVTRWMAESGGRRALVTVAVAASAIIGGVVALPVLPVREAGPVVAVNPDIGETIGWPQFARTVARVQATEPGAVVLTRDYGEAGAVDHYGPGRAYSGHNAYGYWGPPPDGAPVVTVGLPRRDLARLRGCHEMARVDNSAGIDNDERGAIVHLCAGPRGSWSAVWPALRHLG